MNECLAHLLLVWLKNTEKHNRFLLRLTKVTMRARRDLVQVLNSVVCGGFGVKCRHSIRAVSGALLSSSELEEAL